MELKGRYLVTTSQYSFSPLSLAQQPMMRPDLLVDCVNVQRPNGAADSRCRSLLAPLGYSMLELIIYIEFKMGHNTCDILTLANLSSIGRHRIEVIWLQCSTLPN